MIKSTIFPRISAPHNLNLKKTLGELSNPTDRCLSSTDLTKELVSLYFITSTVWRCSPKRVLATSIARRFKIGLAGYGYQDIPST